MKEKCSHCHLEFDSSVLFDREIDGNSYKFCCKGCEGVFILLHSSGLDSFYDKLGKNRLEPPKEKLSDTAPFDTQTYKSQYIREKDGLYETSLIIEGIHCAACVWLNEKVLHRQDGIIEANINYTNNKATILWEPSKIKLSKIIEIIRSIGYDAKPYNPLTQERGADSLRKEYYTKMIVAVFCTMNIMWVAIPLYLGYFGGMRADIKHILHFAEFVLATPALFYSGQIFFKGAWVGLKNRFINMDLLVISGASLVYFYSIYAAITGAGETYFESGTMIITFVLIGKFLEVRGKKSAVDTIDKLNSQIPTEVAVIKDGERLVKSPQEVIVGDIVELKAGEKVMFDGVVISGESAFDQSSISGESIPISKSVGDSVISGSLNTENSILYEVKKSFQDSTLYQIIHMVESALNKKPNIENFANSLSQSFSVAILSIAILSFLGWYFYSGEFEKSFIIAVSVVVIACPCALALATPIASLVGLSSALDRGVVFKEARSLETLAKADVLLLDKTGTITEGKPKVVNGTLYEDFDKSLLYSLLQKSNHPIAKSVSEHLGKQSGAELENFKEIKAKGLIAEQGGKRLFGGNIAFLKEQGVKISHESENSIFAYAIDGKLVALYELLDTPRVGAKEALKRIAEMGIKIIMLTGDNYKTAKKIAIDVGDIEFYSELDPLQKAQKVDELRAHGRVVAMAGDGINDTLALSKSDISVSMGSGADIAVSVGDIVLLNESPKSLYEAFNISRRTLNNIKQNLAISLIYNLVTIPVAIAGYVIPVIAAGLMSLSSILVVLNSLRIKKNA